MGLRTGTFHENYAEEMATFNSKMRWGFSGGADRLSFTLPLLFK